MLTDTITKKKYFNISTASEFFRAGELLKALQAYKSLLFQESLLKSQTPKHIVTQQANIRCTIGVIQLTIGHYTEAAEMFEKVVQVSQLYSIDSIVILRALVNLAFLDLIEERNNMAIQKIALAIQIIEGSQRKPVLTRFLFQMLFRVNSENDLKNLSPGNCERMNVVEAVSISSLVLNKSTVCNEITPAQYTELIGLQHKCYKTFLHYKRYDLAVAALRNILQISEYSSSQIREFYKKELGKIMALGLVDQIQLNNSDIMDTMKQIFTMLHQLQIKIAQPHQRQALSYNLLMKPAIRYTFHQSLKKSSSQSQRDLIIKSLKQISHQNNQLVLSELQKSQFVTKATQAFLSFFNLIFGITNQRMAEAQRIQRKEAFKIMRYTILNESLKKSTPLKRSQLSRKSFSKENLSPIGIQVTSFKHSQTQKLRQSASPLKSVPINRNNSYLTSASPFKMSSYDNSTVERSNVEVRKLTKMLRFCEHGSFLNKRNYTSEGGEYKFVKITSTLVKWGKNPERVDDGGQSYPLKDVRGIIYGKISPTLNKSQNKLLKPYLCFSLILQKRTLDFYCKDYEEIQSWVCGLTVALHKIGQSIVGYTPAKMRWKKAFMVMKWSFIDPLKRHQRNNFYYEDAYAVIQFGNNNYRLP